MSIYLTAGNRVYLNNTQSNTASNQALQIDGGAYVKKDIWFSNNLNIADSGKILGDNSHIKSEEVVADSPLLIIGENNTSDNLLSGFINRYKDNSNNYKFTGLVRNTDSEKTYVLVNNINPDSSNKDLDVSNFNTVATNTSNNYKDNYSSIYITKLNGLSEQYINNDVSAITTKGSLGISKNIYLGDSNNSNAEFHIGDKTRISYNKANNSKFKFNTNVDIDLNTTNNKSINIFVKNNSSKTLEKETTMFKSDVIFKGNSSETYIKNNIVISNDLKKVIPFNYNKFQTLSSVNCNLNAVNDTITIKGNLNSQLPNNSLITNDYNRFYYKDVTLTYKSDSTETLEKNNNLKYHHNINKIYYDNNENKYNHVYDTLKGNNNIRGTNTAGILTNHINNRYSSTLYKDSNETYKKNRTINVGGNLNIDYSNPFIETLNKVEINSSPNISISAQTKYSLNLNTTIGDNGASHLNKLVVQTNSNILYNTISNETYKSNLVLQSQQSNIKYNINYNLDCNSSNNLIESNFNIKYNNNLIETITNRTFSIRPVGGGGAIVPIVCVVQINESNGLISSGSTHKLPTEYVPTDVVSSVNLKRSDLILFNYTPGTHTFSLDTQAGTVSNIDYSCLNGIYKIDFA